MERQGTALPEIDAVMRELECRPSALAEFLTRLGLIENRSTWTNGNAWWMVSTFVEHGRKCFDFRSRLVVDLLEACPRAMTDELRLPYAACYFALRPGLAWRERKTLGGIERDDLTGIYLADNELVPGAPCKGLYVILCFEPDPGLHDPFVQGYLPTSGERLSNAWVRACAKHFEKGGVSVTALRMLTNMILYLNAENAIISPAHIHPMPTSKKKSSKKRRREAKLVQFAGMSGMEHFDVGRKIRIDTSLPRHISADGGGHFHMSIRFTVRGHWHHYRHGPGRSQVKLLWIDEYWKGPEDAPRVHRGYDVG